jgi:hypothetical protein
LLELVVLFLVVFSLLNTLFVLCMLVHVCTYVVCILYEILCVYWLHLNPIIGIFYYTKEWDLTSHLKIGYLLTSGIRFGQCSIWALKRHRSSKICIRLLYLLNIKE